MYVLFKRAIESSVTILMVSYSIHRRFFADKLTTSEHKLKVRSDNAMYKHFRRKTFKGSSNDTKHREAFLIVPSTCGNIEMLSSNMITMSHAVCVRGNTDIVS